MDAMTLERQTTGTVVAVLPVKNEELEIRQEISTIELRAEAIIIDTDEDFNDASEFGCELKRMEAKVMEYWKPKKDAAFKTHRLLCESEKEMLTPVLNAISVVKKVMSEFTQRKEAERRRIEAEARRIAQEESDKKFAEAVKAEESGDAKAAASALKEAQMADSMSRNMAVNSPAPKAVGVSQNKDWEIIAIDETRVQLTIGGVQLHPSTEKSFMDIVKAATLKLIRERKGNINIPGVLFRDIIKTSIRR